jgi:O-antigen/teichoic acid export membrane protein
LKETLIKNSNFKKYLTNVSWLFLEKSLRILEAFFVGLWLAIYLGPSEFGVLTYAQSFVFLFSAFASLGLDQIVIKRLVDYPDKKNEILGTSLFLKIAGFFIMFFLLWGSLQFTNNDDFTKKFVLIIGFSVLFQSFNGIDFYFQSKVYSKYTVYVNSVVILIAGLVKVYLILNNFPLLYFAYVFVLETFLIATGYIFYYLQAKNKIFSWSFRIETAKELLSKSWVLIIGSIAAALYMKIDQVMIKEILGDTSVGLYGAAVKLCSIWLFVTVIITQSVFPSLVTLKKKNQQQFMSRLQQLYDVLLKISLVTAIVYTVFSDFLITFLFGPAYIESSKILVIYIWSIIFVFLSNGSWGFYLNEDLEKFSSIRLVIGAIINIFLNLIFIKEYGLLGAAYATLISYAFSGYIVNVFFQKTRPNFYLQTKSFINFFNYKTWIRPL